MLAVAFGVASLGASWWLRRRSRATAAAARGGTHTPAASPPPPTGLAARAHFLLDWTFTHLNHGSYGTVPGVVVAAQQRIAREVESFPDDFYRRRSLARYRDACAAAGALVSAPASDTVLVANATTGVNTALRCMGLSAGDAVLVTKSTYNACRNVAMFLQETLGVEVVVMPMPRAKPGHTLTGAEVEAAVLDALRDALAAHPNIRAAVVDTLVSMPTMALPTKAMLRLLHSHSPPVKVCVDGAHSPGQQAVDVVDLQCDYFVGNLHKWAFAPKSVAVMYVAPAMQDATQNLVVSHFWKLDLQARFYMRGTSDDSAMLAVPAALQFAERMGGFPAVSAANHRTLVAACTAVCRLWGTEPMVELSACYNMAMVRTPLQFRWFMPAGASADDAEADYTINERIANAVFSRCGAQAVFMVLEGHVYSRLSANLYNTVEDYMVMARHVVDMCAHHTRAEAATASSSVAAA